MVATVWLSAMLFGVYILAFYLTAVFDGDLTRWNSVLPDLYEEGEPAATVGIGLHFAAGGIILILGSIQLIEGVRMRYPRLHHWLGRIYVGASLLTAVGGLTFIAVSGTVGGPIMSLGFGLYGVLTFIASIETVRHARAKRFTQHNAWAWRLYALAIGSWLYRMDYGFWFILANGAGVEPDFTGIFDRVMVFFFYIPNLIVVELLLQARGRESSAMARGVTAVVLLLATLFLLTGTYFFTKELWGPVIIDSL